MTEPANLTTALGDAQRAMNGLSRSYAVDREKFARVVATRYQDSVRLDPDVTPEILRDVARNLCFCSVALMQRARDLEDEVPV